MRNNWMFAWVSALLALATCPALAQDRPEAQVEDQSSTGFDPMAAGRVELEPGPAGEPIRRKSERADSDGVQDRVTAGEALLWVPRVILFPLYLVSEYVVRRPIGWAITGIEEQLLIPKLRHYTTIGDKDGEGVYAGVNPIARFDTGFRFAVGLLFWAERVGWDDSELRLGLDTDFARNATVDARWRLGGGGRLHFTPLFRLEQRDDFRFYGSGSESTEDDQSRFFRRKIMAAVEAELDAPSPGVGATLTAEVSQNEFDCSTNEGFDICGADGVRSTADDLFNGATLNSYDLFRLNARVYADSRPPRPANSSGVRGEVFTRFGTGLSDPEISFIRGGAEASAFWDIYQQRVLGFRVLAETTLRDGEVPFSELILGGGADLMRGFARGRLHGANLVVASVDYRYPVWSLADGTLFFEAGNTFDELSDFEVDALRGSFGFGLRSIGTRHVSFDALVAAGTTRFDDANFGIESVRLSIGTNWGF